jgi:hypothetical protein
MIRLTYTQNCIVVELKIVGMNCVAVKRTRTRDEKQAWRKPSALPPASFGKRGDH